MSIILAGDRSGTGKTTLTLALLAALKQRGALVQSFKVGPDYIDPMFHSAVTGQPCYNLDPVLTSEAYVRHSFTSHSQYADQAVVEGVMGLFDGATGIDDTASTAHIARLLGLPVVLAVDCGRMARSLAALVQGYQNFDQRVKIVGVVLNRVGSDRHLQLLTDALRAINVPILGVFRREKDIELPSRHLGLVPTGEVNEFARITEKLAAIGERCFDWKKLTPLLKVDQGKLSAARTDSERVNANYPAGNANTSAKINTKTNAKPVRIAIAYDSAFNFYYPDNFEALEANGAELIYWSPIKDEGLPEADGLYFGGGFPEVFAAELSGNKSIRLAVKAAIENGMPTYAECGGLMYLCQTLIDFNGQAWPMVGAVAQTVKMGGRLVLGYREAIALTNTPLVQQGQTIIGHEFHKSSIMENLANPVYKTKRFWGDIETPQPEGYALPNLHMSYVHMHWGNRPEIVQRFLASAHIQRKSA